MYFITARVNLSALVKCGILSPMPPYEIDWWQVTLLLKLNRSVAKHLSPYLLNKIISIKNKFIDDISIYSY